jgi:hypothetical protein
MERTIGNLGQEIRQPSNPYANLSREGVRRCQVNALKAMVPDLNEPEKDLPQTAINLGDGYALLRKRDSYDVRPEGRAAQAIQEYLGVDVKIRRWARLRLPNGQTARTAWREADKPAAKVRISCNVKVCPELPYIFHQLIISSFCWMVKFVLLRSSTSHA